MAIHDVVSDVEFAGIPVGKLRPVAVVPDFVVLLVELDPEVVDQSVTEPVDADTAAGSD